MAKLKAKTYPDGIYLAKGKDGKGHFYATDPLQIRDTEGQELDLAELLFDFFGPADVVNPIVFKVAGAVNERGRKFEISAPAKIRTGEMAAHFEDLEGNVVEVSAMRGPDESHPVNGIVLTRDGKLVAQRFFDVEGTCQDGKPLHRLVIVDGHLGGVEAPAVIRRNRPAAKAGGSHAVREEDRKDEEFETDPLTGEILQRDNPDNL